jgi:ferredoxin
MAHAAKGTHATPSHLRRQWQQQCGQCIAACATEYGAYAMPLERKRRRTSPRRSDRTGSNWVQWRAAAVGVLSTGAPIPTRRDIMTMSTRRHRPSHTCACERACVRACEGVRACGALLGRFCAGVRACERAHLMLQRESGTYMPPDARRCGGGRRRTKRLAMYRGGRENRSVPTRVLNSTKGTTQRWRSRYGVLDFDPRHSFT